MQADPGLRIDGAPRRGRPAARRSLFRGLLFSALAGMAVLFSASGLNGRTGEDEYLKDLKAELKKE